MATGFKSVIDVLNAFFGGSWTNESVNQLSEDGLDALANDVDAHYASFVLPERGGDKVRTYSGGATFAVNARLSDTPINIPDSQLLPFSHAATLYVDEIVVDCPLDAWIFSYRDFLSPRPYRGYSGLQIQPLSASDAYGVGHRNADGSEQRSQIQRALARLEVLAPAIEAGWVIPVPHLRVWNRRAMVIATQIRYDVLNLSLLDALTRPYTTPPAQSDHVRGFSTMPTEGVIPTEHARAVIESPMLYFDSVLAVADATDSRFLPTADSDYNLLLQRVTDAGQLGKSVRDGLLVGGIKQVLLPSFEEFSFSTVCEIRRSEAAFSEWRNGVRNLVNGSVSLEVDDLDQHQEMVTASVDEHVADIRATVAKSQTLNGRWKALKPEAIDMSIAAAIWAVPPATSLLKLAGGIAAPLLKRAFLSVVSPTGANNSVVAKFDRAQKDT